jgi:hypothetical protein
LQSIELHATQTCPIEMTNLAGLPSLTRLSLADARRRFAAGTPLVKLDQVIQATSLRHFDTRLLVGFNAATQEPPSTVIALSTLLQLLEALPCLESITSRVTDASFAEIVTAASSSERLQQLVFSSRFRRAEPGHFWDDNSAEFYLGIPFCFRFVNHLFWNMMRWPTFAAAEALLAVADQPLFIHLSTTVGEADVLLSALKSVNPKYQIPTVYVAGCAAKLGEGPVRWLLRQGLPVDAQLNGSTALMEAVFRSFSHPAFARSYTLYYGFHSFSASYH